MSSCRVTAREKGELYMSKVDSADSQDIGVNEHNTISEPHKKSHEHADRLIHKYDRHSLPVPNGAKTHNTASVGENHGAA